MSEETKQPEAPPPIEQPPTRAPHLKPYQFKPGQSGNPSGRPSRKPITERYAMIAETPVDEKIRKALKLRKGATWADAAAVGIFRAIVKGNPAAAKEVRESLEGKIQDEILLTHDVHEDVLERLINARKRFAAIRTDSDKS